MKILVFMRESDLRPAGGPAGYCYNIHEELLRRGEDSVEFLPAQDEKAIKQKNIYRKIMNRMPRFIDAAQIAFRRKYDYDQMLHNPRKHAIDFSTYDTVHFHSTISLYSHRKDLENYSGIVLLTPHTPVPTHQEIYQELPTEWEKRLFKRFYEGLSEIDRYAFQKADYVIYPCEEAEESYLKNWPEYECIRQEMQKKGKLQYIPTGIEPKIVKTSTESVRQKYRLTDTDFTVSFVGRHNQVKGYDLLQKIAKLSWEEGNAFRFLIAGKESPLQGLEDSRWAEIGWTNEPQSIISASDVFVLPNRETYFDIVMLEVMSLGKIIVASRTGGNKYFERIGAKGIMLYDSVEEAKGLLEKINAMTGEERAELGKKNLELFYSKFKTEIFVDKYLEFLRCITIQKKKSDFG